jgi:CheY-like chemotaxis protein
MTKDNLKNNIMLESDNISEVSGLTAIRILFVEDDKVNQMLGKKMLSKSGYSVDVADDGCEAIRLLNINSYDLLITDIKTPNMDGYELTQHIRQSDKSYCAIPIIAISAYPSSFEKQKAISAGMNDYVSKPFSMVELIAAITPFINI